MEGDSKYTILDYLNDYFYHLVFFVIAVAGLILFHLRKRWVPSFRNWSRVRSGYSLSGFRDDIEQGLTSSNFDLYSNLASEDQRQGLDSEAKKQVIKIMNEQGLSFDDARKAYFENKMADNGIDADGLPRDPKLFTFS